MNAKGSDGLLFLAAASQRTSRIRPGRGIVRLPTATCLALAEVGRPVAAWDINGDGAGETASTCARLHGVASHRCCPRCAAPGQGRRWSASPRSRRWSGHGALPAYCASKAGLLGLTRSLAHGLGVDGIRVSAVCPGAVDTPMLAPLLAMPQARRMIEQQVPLGRVAEPDDIARAVRFLLSDEAANVHGTYLVVDGGMTATG